MHDKMMDNPLDMSNNKYQPPRVPSGSQRQRDINPLGYSLSKDSLFLARQKRSRELHENAEELLSGKKNTRTSQQAAQIKSDNFDMFSKYQK